MIPILRLIVCLLSIAGIYFMHLFVMAVLYVVQESHYVLRLYFILLLLVLFQKVISEVTERISFILSHNIRSRCTLIMHPKKLVNLYPLQKNHPKSPEKWAFWRPSSTLDGQKLCNETSHRQSPPSHTMRDPPLSTPKGREL